MATIHINGNILEPASQLQGGDHYAADASHSDYILLHCVAQLSNEQNALVAQLQVGILVYIARNTYLCRYEPHDLEAVRALPFVIYANVYHQDLAISSHIRAKPSVSAALGSQLHDADSGTETAGVEESEANPSATQAQAPINCAITLHPLSKRGPSEIKQHLADLLKLNSDAIQLANTTTICLALRPQDLSKVARVDEVHSIDEIHPIQELCTRVQIDLHIPAQMAGVAPDVLDATDELVAVQEGTGCDVGDQTGVADAPPFHPALTLDRTLWGKFNNRGSTTDDSNGHGTLVTGCIAANGRVRDSFFGTNAKGTAPNAKVVVQANKLPNPGVQFPFQNIFDRANCTIPPTVPRPPAYIHNSSWAAKSWIEPKPTAVPPVVGGVVALTYGPDCPVIDRYLNDNANRNFLAVWAAGNDGTHAGCRIGSQPASKNVLTVGACESSHPLTINAEGRYQVSGRGRGNPNNMAWFSSPGPANGGVRIKPDVVAPGIVLSCRTQRPGDLSYWLVAKPPPPPNVYNYDRVGHSTDTMWNYAEGTSFAAPFVSGMVAIIRKSLIRYRAFNMPSSSLLKALVIHGATDLNAGPGTPTGGPDTGYAPNNLQGWGRANLTKSLSAVIDMQNSNMLNTCAPLQQGGHRSHIIFVQPNRTATLIATMTFMDRPGDLVQSSLVLSVEHQSQLVGPFETRYANRNASDPNLPPAMLRTPDPDNNVQKIIWPGLTAGRIECRVDAVTVTAAAVGAPAFPGQDYAIVWQLVYDR